MRYSFSSCSFLPCISLLLLETTRGSRRGWVCVHMRGITPARPQFETRPLLLDVIEVPRPLNKTGLYSREASIRGKCHGGDVVCVCTEFHSNYVLPLACYNDKQFYQQTLLEANCCCLQTCLLLIFIPFIEYIMHTELLFIYIVLTTCELHCLMCPHYNVWPGPICCCLLLIELVT